MVNNPEEEEVRTVGTLLAKLTAFTWAFGTAAPVLSVTVPEIVPSPAVCARSVRHDAKSIRLTSFHKLDRLALKQNGIRTSLR